MVPTSAPAQGSAMQFWGMPPGGPATTTKTRRDTPPFCTYLYPVPHRPNSVHFLRWVYSLVYGALELPTHPYLQRRQTTRSMRSSAAAVVVGLLACVPASAFVPAPSARFAGTTAGLTRAQQRSAITSMPLRMAVGGDGDSNNKSPWETLTTDMAKKLAVAATVAAVAFSAPGDALAARSGGRMGGRSFSSPSVSPRLPAVCGERVALLAPHVESEQKKKSGEKGEGRRLQLRLFGDESRHLCRGGEFWLRFNLVGFEVVRWQRAVAIGRGWIVVDHV